MRRFIDRTMGALLRSLRRSAEFGELRDELLARLEQRLAAGPGGTKPSGNIYTRFAAPGHYYSPIPDAAEIARDASRIFDQELRPIPGVRIDAAHFRRRLEAFSAFYADYPYAGDRRLRFAPDNSTYSRGDAVVLYSMMREHRPRNIVEIGSGMSTYLMLDIDERFLDRRTSITSIDPYPERMLEGLREGDRERLEIVPARVQDVDLAKFAALGAGDILFVDSTHVTRCDSDVNRIVFAILPSLAAGVLVHFHDMFWPFEYPRSWLLEIGAAWNEIYLLRAFLQYNPAFEIDFYSDYAAHFLRDEVAATIPVFLEGPGSSLWLRRTSVGLPAP